MRDITSQTHNRKPIAALEANWRTEMEGAATYRALADLEANPRRTAVLHKLARAEERHAERWAGRLRELGGTPPADSSHTAAPDVIGAARAHGLDAALRRVEAVEEEHIEAYRAQAHSLDDEPSARIIEDLVSDEVSHVETLRTLTTPGMASSACPPGSLAAAKPGTGRRGGTRIESIPNKADECHDAPRT